jgi:hypothetical protein
MLTDLKKARELQTGALQLLAEGIDPSTQKKVVKAGLISVFSTALDAISPIAV